MQNSRLAILLGLFVGLIIGMNLLGNKIMSLFGVSVSVAIFMVPLTFLITDIVEEVYGKKVVKQFIFVGLFTLIVTFIYTAFFIWLTPHERFAHNEAYTTVFGSSLRIMLASALAFLLAQLNDMYTFAWLKEKTGGRMLWLRNNISTMLSQFIDSVVFMFVAFYMVSPTFTAPFIIQLIIPYYLFKVAFALLDTPFVYLGVNWLKRGVRDLQTADV
jgi:hypothetical protein